MPPAISELARCCLVGTRDVMRAARDFVYPQACPLCGNEDRRIIEATVEGPMFCDGCRESLAPEFEDSCKRCAAPVGPFLETSNGCFHCHADRFRFETVVCLGVYEDLLRTVCLRAKRPGGEPLAAAAAALLWEQHGETLEQAGIDCVLPIPHDWTQRLGRTQNASATLARVLARRLKVEFGDSILAKVRKTPRQAGLVPSKRRMNLRGAFAVRGGSSLDGRSVLLVDDVLTTGTTVNEASKTLKKAGAGRVIVAVLARGLGQSPGV